MSATDASPESAITPGRRSRRSRHLKPQTSKRPRLSELEAAKRLRRVQRYSNLMDARFRLPVVGVRFGMDSVIGLVPGVGDAVTAVTSLWLLREAKLSGVGNRTLLKMAGNFGIDFCVGAVPLLGDVFDVYWKANLRNASLLERHLAHKTQLESRRN